jgi:predicted DNA-binding transcriptional regulator AlpA
MMKRATVCAYLDLSPAELEREIIAGRLPAPVTFGNLPHWSQAEIDAYLERLTGEAEATSDWRKKVKLYQS